MVCLRLSTNSKMRPTRNREEHGSESLVNSKSALNVASVEQLWDEWEIHCLVLLSLALQVFLFLAAGIRRRSASRVLHSLLWLAYVSADMVAVFVLGHLAVSSCTSRPRHELMPFWAPFVLVHLGGQSTITAFSLQDNELWGRHLLGLITQVALAGYVVSKSSLPDGRLLAAMALMFLSGCVKYGERTLCLYLARPAKRRDDSLGSMLFDLQLHRSSRVERQPSRNHDPGAAAGVVGRHGYSPKVTELAGEQLRSRFDRMLDAHSRSGPEEKGSLANIGSGVHPVMSVDAPINDLPTVLCADMIPQLHEQYRRREGRCSKAYGYVAQRLVPFYQDLYTKKPLSHLRRRFLLDRSCSCSPDAQAYGCMLNNVRCLVTLTLVALSLPLLYFSTLSTPIALALFAAADRGGGLRAYSRADVVVSYILLAGAVALDASSSFIAFSDCMRETTDGEVNLHLGSRTKWSEKLAQYNMFRQHAAAQDDAAASVSMLQRWIEKPLKACGVQAFDVTRIALPEDLKELVLDKLLELGAGGQQDWNFASTRGLMALQKWVANHKDSASARPGTALHRSIGVAMDFQTSVLIWHMATDICYHEGFAQASSNPDMKVKRMCRELSNYIMYLIFKCGVMLKTNSQLLHRKAHDELEEAKKVSNLRGVAHEGNPAWMVFQIWKQTGCGMDPLLNFIRLVDELGGRVVKGNEELRKAGKNVHGDGPAEAEALPQGSSGQQPTAHMQLLQNTYENLDSAVTNRACEVAQELIAIEEDECWELITAVWLEMLFFVAPRCGGAFHSQHLSTGGEFITHVLLLMYCLGPFLPSRTE